MVNRHTDYNSHVHKNPLLTLAEYKLCINRKILFWFMVVKFVATVNLNSVISPLY
jgi:hypothetical protein